MIAIIPARAGSKGLPGKNVRPLHGKPLIAYTIEAAKGAQSIDRVILSTESREIADIGVQYGAEVPFLRPIELAQDHSAAIDTYIHVIDRLNDGQPHDRKIDELTVLQPTSPLRTSQDIDEAVKIFQQKQADSILACAPAPHPIQWFKYIDEKGVLRGFFPESLKNRQDHQVCYLPNGAIYVFKYFLLKELRNYSTDKTFPYVMPARRSIDIDTLEDFELAEFFLSKNVQGAS